MISRDAVQKLKKPLEELQTPDVSKYQVRFTSFKIRNPETNEVVFNISDGRVIQGRVEPIPGIPPNRGIRYILPRSFLEFPAVGTLTSFSVGAEPLSNIEIFERHYLGDRLIQAFRFESPFAAPGSSNEWEPIYEPNKVMASAKFRRRAVEQRFAWKVDTFMFVAGTLVLHNKAELGFDE